MTRSSTPHPERHYRPWAAALVAAGSFAANAVAFRLGGVRQGPATPPRATPPDWVFVVGWPLLKLGAGAADVRIAAQPPGHARSALARLRIAEWGLFATFGLAASSRRGSVVLGSTLAQAALTAEAARRVWPRDRRAALLLTPQVAWLAYAGALTAVAARSARQAGTPARARS